MKWLEHRIPPVVVVAIFALAMWLLSLITTRVPIAPGISIMLSTLLVGLAIGLMLSGALAFRRARTTLNPIDPTTSSKLVMDGVFRFSRNPMYLGMALVLLAWAVYLASVSALLGPCLFVAYMTRFQIIPEERALTRKFAAAFSGYQKKVRRWL